MRSNTWQLWNATPAPPCDDQGWCGARGASQGRLCVFQAFGAETNRGTAAASQPTNGGMTTLLMNALIICVGGEVGAGVVFMGLWQSFGVAAKQTPHLLFSCSVYNWRDTYFKHMLAHPPFSLPRYPPTSNPLTPCLCLFLSPHRDRI